MDVAIPDHLPWLYLNKSKGSVAFLGLYSELSEILRHYLGVPKVPKYIEVPKTFLLVFYLGFPEYITVGYREFYLKTIFHFGTSKF